MSYEQAGRRSVIQYGIRALATGSAAAPVAAAQIMNVK
jgi:hypothetical protein